MSSRRTFLAACMATSLVVTINHSAISADDASIKLPAKEKLHLYLLIGQSNMAGRGEVEAADKVAHPRVLAFSKDHAWTPAVDPLHFDKSSAGVGLGSTFGRVMAEADPSITIGLVPCAVGGTPLSRWEKDRDLYEQAIVRAKLALKDGTLKGILWHQGEADSAKEETARSYADRLSQMIQDMRAELNAEQAPFVAGELGRFLRKVNAQGNPSFWPLVNEQLHAIPARVPRTAVASSEGLAAKSDQVHFDSASLREYGKRYAAAMQNLQAAKTP